MQGVITFGKKPTITRDTNLWSVNVQADLQVLNATTTTEIIMQTDIEVLETREAPIGIFWT